MKKLLLLTSALLCANVAYAETNHYFLRDGNHVRHLKIATVGDTTTVAVDVDFEPNADEAGKYPCSAQIAGEAKKLSDTQILLKKHAESAASYCELTITLGATGAQIAQSEGCEPFVAGICRFATDGKELAKMR